jgi:hypothetical protein
MTRFCLIVSILFSACSVDQRHEDNVYKSFKFPHIKQNVTTDSGQLFLATRISEVYPKFVGQCKFTDSITYNGEREKRDYDEQQYLWERRVYDFDTLSSDGLQIFADYKTSVVDEEYDGAKTKNLYYPVYVVNETKSPKLFVAKDDHVFAIQEAVDTSRFKDWYAIESQGFDFCGNGYFRRKLMPQEFIMFLMPKYSGTDTTLLRTRIKIGDVILVSAPYKGVIDQRQFKATKDNWAYEDIIKPDGFKWMFYGGQYKK